MSDKEDHLDRWWRNYLSRSSTKITFAHLYFHDSIAMLKNLQQVLRDN